MAHLQKGTHSFILDKPPVITAWASVAGNKESQGPLASYIDLTEKEIDVIKAGGRLNYVKIKG